MIRIEEAKRSFGASLVPVQAANADVLFFGKQPAVEEKLRTLFGIQTKQDVPVWGNVNEENGKLTRSVLVVELSHGQADDGRYIVEDYQDLLKIRNWRVENLAAYIAEPGNQLGCIKI